MCIWYLIQLFLMLCVKNVYSATIIPANGSKSTHFAFTVPVTATTFDIKSGSFIVGLTQGASEYAVSIANDATLQFEPIAHSSPLTDSAIELLTVGQVTDPLEENTFPLIGTVTLNTTAQSNNILTVTTLDGSQTVSTVPFNDANPFLSESAGISSIAGASERFFAAVRNNANDFFGIGQSGIAVGKVALDQEGTVTVSSINSVTGGVGNLAFPISINNTALFGGPTLSVATNAFSSPLSFVPLYWDPPLKCLYMGISCLNDGAGNPFMNVVRLFVNENTEALIAQSITQISAIDGDNIIATTGPNQQLLIPRLAVMHTSTGLSYLVVQGGSESSTPLFINKVRALPLVDDPVSQDHGAIANKNAALVDGVFKVAAVSSGDLPLMTDPAALVGDTDNIPSDLATLIQNITDMHVVGDTVYIAVNNGVFGYVLSSQALFDTDGKIARWTPWAQRATPVNAFPGINMPDTNTKHSGRIAFFAVDNVTGKIWLIEGDTQRLGGLLGWATQFQENSLPDRINRAFIKGCYSALDLHHKTTLIGLNNNNYSLFGGSSLIAFARTRDELLSGSSPAGTVTDFSDARNFLLTYLPTGNRMVTALEYTSGQQNNYFLAGTPQGLYVFCSTTTGQGFLPTALGTLDQPPFTTSSWQLAPSTPLQKAIIDIKCAENNVYIITFDRENPQELYHLYGINPAGKTTLQDTFGESNLRLLATSNSGVFDTIHTFNACAIVHTGTETTAANQMPEQLLLATNQGMWMSRASQSGGAKGIATATDEQQAQWEQLTEHNNQFFPGIASIDTPVQHTHWPFFIEDTSLCAPLMSMTLTQLSQAGNSNGTLPASALFDPRSFNTPNDSSFNSVFDPFTYFWTDGARRFFLFNRFPTLHASSTIAVIPFDVTHPLASFHVANIPSLTPNLQFYWIRSIGDLGIILAGTNTGVVGLQ